MHAAAAVAAQASALVRLPALTRLTEGAPGVTVAVVDGPADLTHPDLSTAHVTSHGAAACAPQDGACRHGTAVVSALAASRAGLVPGLCPGCRIGLWPLLATGVGDVRPADLASAVRECIASGARVISLSLGLALPRPGPGPALRAALDEAARRGVVVVAAAGNHGIVGPVPLLEHPWPVLVTACDEHGRLLPDANLGIGVGRQGLCAPGRAVPACAPGGGYQYYSGTSAAVPFVTGTAALLWSLAPHLPGARIRAALLQPGVARRSVVPPLLDAEASLQALTQP